MKQNTSVFLKEQKELGLPELEYDLLLADGPYPFLFTCANKEETETYLVVCHTSDAEKTEYIMVRRSPVRLQALLKDQLTIREALVGEATHVYVITYPRGEATPQVRYVAIEDLSPKVLPASGYYMDARPGEFDEELAILEKRVLMGHLHCVTFNRCSKLDIQPFAFESDGWTFTGKTSSHNKRSTSWRKKQAI